jgi:hypothetical protein
VEQEEGEGCTLPLMTRSSKGLEEEEPREMMVPSAGRSRLGRGGTRLVREGNRGSVEDGRVEGAEEGLEALGASEGVISSS